LLSCDGIRLQLRCWSSSYVIIEKRRFLRPLECRGLWPIWTVLRGDAVPLGKNNTDDDNGDSPKSLLLLPNLTHRAVRAYLDRPRIAIGNLCGSLGPASTVVIDTPYVDDRMRIRIDKGGTLGTQFVVLRVPETDTEATDKWQWLLGCTESSCITKRKASWGLATAGMDSQCRRMASIDRPPLPASISITSTILSVVALLGVVLSTGGIETRGGTYAPGKLIGLLKFLAHLVDLSI
jgi:hypothetical protein